jgi:hypothetical protein
MRVGVVVTLPRPSRKSAVLPRMPVLPVAPMKSSAVPGLCWKTGVPV